MTCGATVNGNFEKWVESAALAAQALGRKVLLNRRAAAALRSRMRRVKRQRPCKNRIASALFHQGALYV
jgi:hypothetical protein